MSCTTSADLGVEIAARRDGTTIRLAGDVVAACLPTVRRALDSLSGTAPITVDLSRVTYIDSAAVALLFEVAGARGLELVLGPSCAVFPIVQVCGLAAVATIR